MPPLTFFFELFSFFHFHFHFQLFLFSDLASQLLQFIIIVCFWKFYCSSLLYFFGFLLCCVWKEWDCCCGGFVLRCCCCSVLRLWMESLGMIVLWIQGKKWIWFLWLILFNCLFDVLFFLFWDSFFAQFCITSSFQIL